jgi:hypothetical protein
MRIEDRFGDEVLFLPSKIQLQCWLCKSESKHSHRKVVLVELRVNELYCKREWAIKNTKVNK